MPMFDEWMPSFVTPNAVLAALGLRRPDRTVRNFNGGQDRTPTLDDRRSNGRSRGRTDLRAGMDRRSCVRRARRGLTANPAKRRMARFARTSNVFAWLRVVAHRRWLPFAWPMALQM